MSAGVKSVLVKLGADGSLLLPGPGQPPLRQAAIRAEQVVDTTGARCAGGASGWMGGATE